MDVVNAMADVPSNLRFTPDHLWLGADRNGWIIGITQFAQAKLGALVYVDIPRRGTVLRTAVAFSFVESSKAVVDLVSPINSVVVTSNDRLVERPDLVNRDPYGEGWICLVEAQDPVGLRDLLDARAYQRLLSNILQGENA